MPEVETSRLHLRMFTPEDLNDLYFRIYSDPGVMRYLPGGLPRTLERTAAVLREFAAHWERHGFGAWAIEDRENNEFIGQVGLQYIEDTADVEVFYALGRDFWGQGLATEAARAALRYGFEHEQLKRIWALAAYENIASQCVLIKVGMRYARDAEMYGLKVKMFTLETSEFDPGGGFYQVRV